MTESAAPGGSDLDGVVPCARIVQRGDQPYSLEYDDIYHAADGAAEVQRVFLAPCGIADLASRRARADHPARRLLRIGELGFGSGLNFVVAAERCLAAGADLHFVSFEARPIDAADFLAIAGRRRTGHPLYAELAEAYPPRLAGWHRRTLAGGRIRLTLWFGDATAGLADLEGRQRQPFDAWFLDGFAPDRNPEMWQQALFSSMAGLSAEGTRVATFTAAGRVRRGLAEAGFAMERIDQRPHKRETLAGTRTRPGLTASAPPRQVTVVGGGLAGASCAWHLARSGIGVCLIDDPEPESAGAGPASRIPATVLHTRLLADGSASAALRSHAYLYAASAIRGLPGFAPGGVLQLAGASDRRLRDVAARYRPSGAWLDWLEARDAAELAGWPAAGGGLLLSGGGAVDLPRLVGSLIAVPGVTVERRRLTELPAGPVVLAAGPATRLFGPADYLEIAAVHGQIDLVSIAAAPRLPLVGDGYLVPLGAAGPGSGVRLAAGSTYEYRPWEPQTATAANLRQLAGHQPVWQERVRGSRCVSSDRAAIAGPLYSVRGEPLADRYVSTGHGSAGNASAHLAAAVICAHLTGDCPPLAGAVEAALSAARFRQRQARRGIRHGIPRDVREAVGGADAVAARDGDDG